MYENISMLLESLDQSTRALLLAHKIDDKHVFNRISAKNSKCDTKYTRIQIPLRKNNYHHHEYIA